MRNATGGAATERATFEGVWVGHWRPRRPLSGDVKDPGHPALRRRSRQRALEYPYVETNPLVLRSLLVIDHDGGEARWAAERAGLPDPSRVSLNPHTGTGHIEYALRDPVVLTDTAHRAPVNLLARIEHGLSGLLDGDVAYGGKKNTKNPWNAAHTTVWGPATALYGLRQLARALDQLGALPRARDPRRHVPRSIVGRNCALFDLIRKWAYPRRGDHNQLSTWEHAVFAHAWTLNETIIATEFTPGPLTATETGHIARSIARWTWRNIHHTYTAEQARRGRAGGRITAATGGREQLTTFNTTRGRRHDRQQALKVATDGR